MPFADLAGRLWMQFELGMTSMQQLGFSAKDLDEVKGIFTETNMVLLLVTMFVSAVHVSQSASPVTPACGGRGGGRTGGGRLTCLQRKTRDGFD